MDLQGMRQTDSLVRAVKLRNRCIYCGVRVRGMTCNAHRHLPRYDPLRTEALRRLSGDAPKIEHR